MAFLGLDISTTAAKAILINREGNVIASYGSPLSISQPRPLWSEQDPAEWWSGMVNSIRHVMDEAEEARVEGIGLTGQMHGLVLLDKKGDVIRPAILWNDQRTGPQCNQIRELVGRERLIQLTGNDVRTGFTAPKLLWVRDQEPDQYARVATVLLPKDYIRYRLSGTFATDLAGASGTLLLDIGRRCWSEEMLRVLDIPQSWLPPTREGTMNTGTVRSSVCEETGLPEGTPIFAGGGDQSAQAVGVGSIDREVVSLTLGTSGVVFAPTTTYIVEPQGRLHAFCHAVPGMWHLMGVMLSAAGSLKWYRDNFSPGIPYEDLVKEAETVPAGADGLIFLPYLMGERTPYPDPLARAAFIGLTARHSRANLTRAVMEGVGFGLRDCLGLMREVGIHPGSIVASGGGIRSQLWRQILADMLGVEIVTVNSQEGAAFGAALLAATGAGFFRTISEACHHTIHVTSRTKPGEAAVVYDLLYPHYRSAYPSLAQQFHALSGFPGG